jgi:hypothetical protein
MNIFSPISGRPEEAGDAEMVNVISEWWARK